MARVFTLLENQAQQEQPQRARAPHPRHIDIELRTNSYGKTIGDYSYSDHQGRRRRHKKNDYKVKVEAPKFEGNLNPNDFVDGIHDIEQVFDFHSYSDKTSCKIVVLS